MRFLPDHPSYAAEIAPFNRAIVHRPAVAVAATTAAEVAAAVAEAAAHDLPVAVQATGHGAVMPVDAGVLISTRRMRGLSIDPRGRTARVEAGVPWSEAIAAAARFGLAPLNGSSVTVGAIGYLTGGGLGPLSRAYGFAVDHVRSLELVTPDGRLRHVDAGHEPELFWGVRGGKGNFGVVTSAVIGLFDVARLYGGGLYFAAEDVPAVAHAYREWVPTLPADSHVALALLRLPRLPHVPPPVLAGRLVAHLRVTHLGERGAAERDLAPMRALARPLVDTVRELPYAEVGTIHNEPEHPMANWGRGALLRELPPAAVDALLEAAGPGADPPLAVVELRPLGGAAAREPEHPSAVDGRDAAYSLNVLGPLQPGREAAVRAAGERLLAALAPWSTGGSLINFQGAAVAPEQVAAAWRPATYARLARLKRAIDPQHLFRFGHVIEPAPPAAP